jgi:threonine dehydratase
VNKKIALDSKQVALVISGGNIDVNLISRIIEKGLIQGGRLAKISVVLSDRPGSLARLAANVANEGANVLSIGHARGFGEIAIGETEVELILETTGWDHLDRLHKALEREGFRIDIASSAPKAS